MEIQLVLKSHEQALVTKASQLVIFFAETVKRKTSQDWNLTVQPLPTQLKKYTLLRSPHVNKKISGTSPTKDLSSLYPIN